MKAQQSASGGKGVFSLAVGALRSGRTTRFHCLSDARGRIVAPALMPGNMADITMVIPLLEAIRPTMSLIANKAYDADGLRNWRVERLINSVIPGRAARDVVSPLIRKAYRRRNVIERMFGHLKTWKRIATSDDRLTVNDLTAIALIATVTQWLERVAYLCSKASDGPSERVRDLAARTSAFGRFQ